MTAEGGCISPYRDFDIRSDRRVKAVGRCASFISTSNMSTSGGTGYGGTGNNGGRNFSGGSGNQSSASLRNSRAANYNRSSNVYYTMNFCGVDDQDDSMDSEELLSPNRNQMTYSCKYKLIIFIVPRLICTLIRKSQAPCKIYPIFSGWQKPLIFFVVAT